MNKFSGTLPVMPASVTTMDLSTNFLEGPLVVGGNVPLGIGFLLLDRNRFSGPISDLARCKSLTVFSIEHNPLVCGPPPFPLPGDPGLAALQANPAYAHELVHRCNAIRLHRQARALGEARGGERLGEDHRPPIVYFAASSLSNLHDPRRPRAPATLAFAAQDALLYVAQHRAGTQAVSAPLSSSQTTWHLLQV